MLSILHFNKCSLVLISARICSNTAVSYTHLDVYKRQTLKFFERSPHIFIRSNAYWAKQQKSCKWKSYKWNQMSRKFEKKISVNVSLKYNNLK